MPVIVGLDLLPDACEEIRRLLESALQSLIEKKEEEHKANLFMNQQEELK